VKRPVLILSAVVCSLVFLSACAPGNRLVVPGQVERPPAAGPPPAGPPAVAVTDFAFTPAEGEPGVIGRDHDQVRQVVWNGEPGRTMADLVAGAFADRGVRALRVKAGDPAPDNVARVVSGTVRRFELSVRRRNMLSVYVEATVALSLTSSGAGAAAPWETSVSSSAVLQDVFPLAEDLRKVLSSAANSAAEEGVRRLQEGGATGTSR